MKKTTLYILISFLLIISSCESLKYPVTGKITDTSECKSSEAFNVKGLVLRASTPDTLSCVEYSYDEDTETLTLLHINAGFNCCPGKISCKISTSNDTILIEEKEEQSICDCDCLYDLTITLENVLTGEYIIKFIEPYSHDMKELIFNVDFTKLSVGEFCVTRKSYPWGIYQWVAY